jgi:hypothetical protein
MLYICKLSNKFDFNQATCVSHRTAKILKSENALFMKILLTCMNVKIG